MAGERARNLVSWKVSLKLFFKKNAVSMKIPMAKFRFLPHFLIEKTEVKHFLSSQLDANPNTWVC